MNTPNLDNDNERERLLERTGFLNKLRELYVEPELFNKARQGALDGLFCISLICGNEREKAVEELLIAYEGYERDINSPYWKEIKSILNRYNAFEVYKEAEKQFFNLEISKLEQELEKFKIIEENKLLILSMDSNFN